MRIAVSAAGPTKDSPAQERFGRCVCFVVYDDETGAMEAVNNEGMTAAEGAGIKSTGLLLRKRVDVVLTGRVGPKAMHALLAGGVAVYAGVEGTVAETLEKYRSGLLSPLGIPNARTHAGKNPPELSAE